MIATETTTDNPLIWSLKRNTFTLQRRRSPITTPNLDYVFSVRVHGQPSVRSSCLRPHTPLSLNVLGPISTLTYGQEVLCRRGVGVVCFRVRLVYTIKYL